MLLLSLAHTQERACPTFELKPFPAAAAAAPLSHLIFSPFAYSDLRPGAFSIAPTNIVLTLFTCCIFIPLSLSLCLFYMTGGESESMLLRCSAWRISSRRVQKACEVKEDGWRVGERKIWLLYCREGLRCWECSRVEFQISRPTDNTNHLSAVSHN